MNSRPFFVLTCCLCIVALALSLYVWQLRKRSAEDSASATTPEVVTAPSDATPKPVILWVARDDIGALKSQTVSVAVSSDRQRGAEDILRALLAVYTGKGSPHALPPGAGVRNVYFLDPGLVVIDVNSALAAGQTSGILAEELTIASFIQTLGTNAEGVSRVKFLVDGKQASTLAGHADLSNIYDVSQFAILSK